MEIAIIAHDLKKELTLYYKKHNNKEMLNTLNFLNEIVYEKQ